MLDQLRARGYPEERLWLVVNRVNMKGGVSVEDIERRLRVRIKAQITDDQPLVTYSVNVGVPVMVSHPRSALARGYQALARELLASIAPEPQGEAAGAGQGGGGGARRTNGDGLGGEHGPAHPRKKHPTNTP